MASLSGHCRTIASITEGNPVAEQLYPIPALLDVRK
jgi:hypothetical protein